MSLNASLKLSVPSFKNLKPQRLLRYLPVTTLALLLLATGFTLSFLYRYFYQTIAQVKVVSILQSQVALTQVNLPLYHEVLSAFESKKAFDESQLAKLRDPFQPLPESGSASQGGTDSSGNLQTLP